MPEATTSLISVNLETQFRRLAMEKSPYPDWRAAEVVAPGKCATITTSEGVAYVAGHSRCAKKLWEIATDGEVCEERPRAPWVAFRGIHPEDAEAYAFMFLQDNGYI